MVRLGLLFPRQIEAWKFFAGLGIGYLFKLIALSQCASGLNEDVFNSFSLILIWLEGSIWNILEVLRNFQCQISQLYFQVACVSFLIFVRVYVCHCSACVCCFNGPIMILIAAFSCMARDAVCVPLTQKGTRYAAVKHANACAVAQSLLASALYVLAASFWMRLVLGFIFLNGFSKWTLQAKVLSSVTPGFFTN